MSYYHKLPLIDEMRAKVKKSLPELPEFYRSADRYLPSFKPVTEHKNETRGKDKLSACYDI